MRWKLTVWVLFLGLLAGCAPSTPLPSGGELFRSEINHLEVTLVESEGEELPEESEAPSNSEVIQKTGLQIEAVKVKIFEGMLKPHISVSIFGQYTDSCTEILKYEDTYVHAREGNVFYITINPTKIEDVDCLLAPGSFFRGVGLLYDSLDAGTYVVDVHGTQTVFTLSEDVRANHEEVDRVTAAVYADLLITYDVDSDAVSIVSFQSVTWLDSCLDVPEEGEMCEEEEIPGYRVTASNPQQSWEYHTNADGSRLRVAEVHREYQGILLTVSPDQEAVIFRTGPGTVYPVVGQLLAGETVVATGRSASGHWVQILVEGVPEGTTWLYAPLTDYAPGLNLPVVAPSPTPVP